MSLTDPLWPYVFGSFLLIVIAYRVSIFRQKLAVRKILKQSLRSQSVRKSHFQMQQRELVQSFSEETDPPRDRKDLIVELFDSCGFEMSEELPDSLLLFAKENLSNKQKWYLRFECLVYLFFWADMSALSNNQNEHTRRFLRNSIDYVLQGFVDRDASLEKLVDIRLAGYARGYQSGGNMSNAQHMFLSNLMVLAQTGQIRKTIDLPFGSAIERAADYGEILTGMTSHTILLVALKHVFDAGDFERLSAAQIKELVTVGIQNAKPFEMKVGPLFLLR